jgi:hypothetical protein
MQVHSAVETPPNPYELGQLLSFLYEEGVLGRAGITSLREAFDLIAEGPLQVFRHLFALHRQLPEEAHIAQVRPNFECPPGPLTGQALEQFRQGFRQTSALVLLTRYYLPSDFVKEEYLRQVDLQQLVSCVGGVL